MGRLYLLLFAVLELCSGTKPRNRLYGKHLRVAIGHLPPSSLFVRNSTGHIVGYKGQAFEFFDWLSKSLHFTFTWLPAPENIVGRYLGGGNYSGTLGQIVRKEFDISLGPFAPTLERYGAIEFVIHSGGSSSWLVTKYPESRLSDSAVFEPYTPILWLLWLSSMVVLGVFSFVMVYFREDYQSILSNRYRNIDAMFLYLLGTMTGQGGYYRSGSQSIRFTAAIWCFTAFCFINIYNSILTSRLSAHYQFPEIKSLDDLAKNKNYELATLRGSVWDLDFLSAKNGSLGIIGERYRKCGDRCSLFTVPEVMKKPLEGNYIAYIAYAYAAVMLEQDFHATKKCRMTLGSIDYGFIYSFMGIAKDSPYLEEFHRESLWANAFGFDATNKKWPGTGYALPQQCVLKYNSKGISVQQFSVPIQLKQIYPAFVLLLTGYGLGILLFLLEKVYFKSG